MASLTRTEAQSWMRKVECAGWSGLIDRVFDALPEGLGITQVYQKWGALRFDLDRNPPPELEALLDAIEDESRTICQVCGAPGTETSEHGWVDTLCERPQCLARCRSV